MHWRSAISPTDCAASHLSCSPGRGRSGNYRAPSGWNCSSFSPSAGSIAAPRTASSAARPGRHCAASRPRSGRLRTDLPLRRYWSGYAGSDSGAIQPEINPVQARTAREAKPGSQSYSNHVPRDSISAGTDAGDARLIASKSARLRPDSATMMIVRTTDLRLSRMPKTRSFFRVFAETGPLIVLAVAVALLVGIVGPASAQFFNFGGPPQRPPPPPRYNGGGFGGGGGWFGGDLFAPFQQQQAP